MATQERGATFCKRRPGKEVPGFLGGGCLEKEAGQEEGAAQDGGRLQLAEAEVKGFRAVAAPVAA
jgi:hypothetical protein